MTVATPRRARFFFPIVAALAATFAGSALAQQVTLRVHHFLPGTSSAQQKIIQPWCDKVARESNDRLKCQIFPAMSLGGTPPQLFEQARTGVADLIWTVPTYTAGRFSKSEVFELPWMAVTAKSGSQALWTYVDKHAQDEFKGVHRIFMHVHDGALFHFAGKTPRTLEELKGLRIRAATRANSRTLMALGASPVSMPLPSVPDALSKSVVEGAVVPWEGVPSIRLNEFAKYHLDVPEGSPRMSNTIFLFGMNEDKYNSLPADLKKIIDDNSGLATSAWAGEVGFDAVVAPHKKIAKDAGGNLQYVSDAEFQRWVKATESVAEDWAKEVSAKGADGRKLLEEARALVRQYAQ